MIFTRKSGQHKGYIPTYYHVVTYGGEAATAGKHPNSQFNVRKLRVQLVLSNFDKKIFILNYKCARNNYIKLLQNLN